MQTSAQHSKSLPHLVIVGGGFSGLSAAKEVAGKPVRVTLIDRINHHLFQPIVVSSCHSWAFPGTLCTREH
jgi:NADH:ubiquinone reductase (H+-translocating)